ncbi:histone deacetylase 8 [Naematelia encephala]|uniref:Histone deacetylase 8 n=1 Tax=Naematelia encephala TaxID=71784 RepID=A0A1Y2BDF5_9TREE|nr:histone deacetylase 8 [Naematelia encephala]
MPRVQYVWSTALQAAADQLPANIGRSSIVHDLVFALDLVENAVQPDQHLGSRDRQPRGRVICPDLIYASFASLEKYHDKAYVEYLLATSDQSTTSDDEAGSKRKRRRTELHGLEHDCPTFDALPQYACLVAASTMTACQLLAEGESDITINWDGGRHHAMRNRASGFCYVADAVLGIMLLSKKGEAKGRKGRPRILYLDLDLHYGDGVAQAFLSPRRYAINGGQPRPPQVLTLSIHHRSPVFFPPSPYSDLPAENTTHPFTLSIPLSAYPSRMTYAAIWPSVERIRHSFNPDYVVLQLGVDGLARDPIGQFGSWSVDGEGGVLWCVEQVKAWDKPLCVLGGGGYNHADSARAWARSTAVLLGREISSNTPVPEHDHWPEYGPSFTLEVSEGRSLRCG